MPTKVTVAAKGLQGAPGLGVATAAYIHDQPTPATTWNIVHNLGYHPNVTVQDSAGTIIEGAELTYIDTTRLRASFAAAFAGRAFLS